MTQKGSSRGPRGGGASSGRNSWGRGLPGRASGPRAGPGFLTCSAGPQNGALGPVGKAGRNLYMAGVGGLVLCADRALSGGEGPRSGWDRSAPLPPLGCSHLTSTARARGLQVAAKRASLHLRGQWRPQVQRLLIQPVQAALGLEGDMVSGVQGTGQGQGFIGNSILAPRTLTLPLFGSVVLFLLLRGPANLAASRSSPSPAHPRHPRVNATRPRSCT